LESTFFRWWTERGKEET